jgi:hypothetical protein
MRKKWIVHALIGKYMNYQQLLKTNEFHFYTLQYKEWAEGFFSEDRGFLLL